MKIIVADDDKTQRILLRSLLRSRLELEVLEASNGQECIDLLLAAPDEIGAVIMDLSMPVMDGKEALQIIHQKSPHVPVLILTASQALENAVQSLKDGAFDFLLKPLNPELLLMSVRNALQMYSLTEQVSRLQRSDDGRFRFSDIIGFDSGLVTISSDLRKAAASEIPLLITGETGTGKEIIACALHGEGNRCGKKFIAVNCGAIPENLVESTLFGHEKGALQGR